MELVILLRGLAAPLRLTKAGSVLGHLPAILARWPFDGHPSDADVAPCFSISGLPDSGLPRCRSHVDDGPSRSFDPVNAICGAISSLPTALPAEHPELNCLRAAGVAIGGRPVVVPNVRRAGKSTLAAVLARTGHAMFRGSASARPAADQPFRQRPGTVAVPIGEQLYLADAEGRAIHQLDPLAAAIRAIIEDPVSPAGLADRMAETFPDAGGDRVAADLDRLIRRLRTAGLIEPRADRRIRSRWPPHAARSGSGLASLRSTFRFSSPLRTICGSTPKSTRQATSSTSSRASWSTVARHLS